MAIEDVFIRCCFHKTFTALYLCIVERTRGDRKVAYRVLLEKIKERDYLKDIDVDGY